MAKTAGCDVRQGMADPAALPGIRGCGTGQARVPGSVEGAESRSDRRRSAAELSGSAAGSLVLVRVPVLVAEQASHHLKEHAGSLLLVGLQGHGEFSERF